jgi:hypothetical protein
MLTRLHAHRGHVHAKLLRRPTAAGVPRAVPAEVQADRIASVYAAQSVGLPAPGAAAFWKWLASRRGEGAWR